MTKEARTHSGEMIIGQPHAKEINYIYHCTIIFSSSPLMLELYIFVGIGIPLNNCDFPETNGEM